MFKFNKFLESFMNYVLYSKCIWYFRKFCLIYDGKAGHSSSPEPTLWEINSLLIIQLPTCWSPKDTPGTVYAFM